MKVNELAALLNAQNIVENANLDAEVTCGYTCDLLSWVLAHGKQGMAWITVQTHVNVVAVAVLMEMACVLLPEGVELDEAALAKACDEGLAVLRCPQTAYELCGRMHDAGVPVPVE